jgi:tetratricopeptide (TPR) repeat protein
MNRVSFAGLVSAICLLAPVAAMAQQSEPGPKNVVREAAAVADGKKSMAILIGVQDYSALPKLKYCRADVQLLAETLKRQCRFDSVVVMTEEARERRYRPSLGNLARELRQRLLLANSGEYQRVLLYFSGHGFRDAQNRLYFAPPDCDRKNLELTALPQAYVKQMLDGCTRIPVKLLVLDCCHAGEAKGAGVGAGADEMTAAFKTAKGLLTLSSCSSDEVSLEWDEKGNGLFTYWLCEGLRGKADRDRDRQIDAYELHRYVYGNVLQTATAMGQDQTVVLRPSDDWKGIAVLSRLDSTASTPPPAAAPANVLPTRPDPPATAPHRPEPVAAPHRPDPPEQAPQDVLVRVERALEAGNIEQAVVALQHQLDSDPDAPDREQFFRRMAEIQNDAGRQADAAETLQRLLEEFPDLPGAAETWLELGELAEHGGDHRQAAQAYYTATQQAGRSELGERATLRLAWCYFHVEDFDRALKTAQYQRANWPDGALAVEAEFMTATCLLRQERFAEALGIFQRLGDLPREDLEAMRLLHASEAAGHLRQWPHSLEYVDECLRRFPESPQHREAFCQKAWVLQNLGDAHEALPWYEKAAEGGRDEIAARAMVAIGRIHQDHGDRPAAVETFSHVLQHFRFPHWQAYAALHLGECLEAMGDFDAARQHYSEAAELLPDSPIAEQAHEHLRRPMRRR